MRQKLIFGMLCAACFLLIGKGVVSAAGQSVVIDGKSYEISESTPYLLIVPETISIGSKDTVYAVGKINGSITVTAPKTVVLSERDNSTNKVSCTVSLGSSNALTLTASTDIKVESAEIRTDFSEKAPQIGSWSGTVTYSVKENIVKDVTDYLEFSLSSDGKYYIITGVKTDSIISYCGNNLVLPSHYNGLPIKEIGERAFSCGSGGVLSKKYKESGVITVTIPSTVTQIGKQAFWYFGGKGTKFIIEGNALKTIGYQAFNNGGLSSVNLPDSLEVIESGGFSYCPNLETIRLPQGIKTINNYAFESCHSLSGNIHIPSSITSMGTYAFQRCENIKTVTWACTQAEIPTAVFKYCSSLNSFTVVGSAQNTITKIKSYSFYDCTSLKQVIIPPKVAQIEYMAFGKTGITAVTCPTGANVHSKAFPEGCTVNRG